jgi:hypothetical protein
MNLEFSFFEFHQCALHIMEKSGFKSPHPPFVKPEVALQPGGIYGLPVITSWEERFFKNREKTYVTEKLRKRQTLIIIDFFAY